MNTQRFILGAALALLFSEPLLPAGPGRIDALNNGVAADLDRAVNQVYPALVRIHVVYENGEGGRMRKGRASGSGTIISPDGYILTNHHVAGRATRITCRLANREEIEAELIGTDPLCDLAIIKLDLSSRRDPKAKLPVAKFGDSDKLRIGDVVLAMGSPSGLSQSVTKGIVANTAMIMPSASGFMLDGENVGELVRWIGHDAVIYHGNSGGPLVNLKGEIVGVNEIGIATMGGAIPGNLAQAAAKELIAKGFIARSWIGLEVQPLLKQMTNGAGILVSAILPESPAKTAGIVAGDLITEVNGTPVAESRAPEDVPVFNRLVLAAPVGSKLILKGLHHGSPAVWSLTTVSRERNEAREQEVSEWGLTVRDFTRISALENRRTSKRGVLVDSVRSGGPSEASKPALKSEDILTGVNGREIVDAAGLAQFTKEFTRALAEPKPVLVTFERDSQELATVIKIGPEIVNQPPGRTARAWLGVETQVLTSELAEQLGLAGKKGVRVTQVSPDSPAKKAGIQKGDIFLKLDGQVIPAGTLSDQELFQNLIYEYKVGSEIELAGLRSEKPLTLTATLDHQPKPASELAEWKDEQFQFKARDISYNDRVNDMLADDIKGVRIVTVERAGWTALAGLSSGDILISIADQPTASIDSLKKILAQLRERKPPRVRFFIQRGIHTRYLEIEPRWEK
jgi:serine protease Do